MRLILISVMVCAVGSLVSVIGRGGHMSVSTGVRCFLSRRSFSRLVGLQMGCFGGAGCTRALGGVGASVGRVASVTSDDIFFMVARTFDVANNVVNLFVVSFEVAMLILLFVPVGYIMVGCFTGGRGRVVSRFVGEGRRCTG